MSQLQTNRGDCYICGRGHTDILETHHIVPRRHGGGGDDNLVELCPNCHAAIEKLYGKDFYAELGVEDKAEYEKEQFNTYVYTDYLDRLQDTNRSNTQIVNTALQLYFHVVDQGGETVAE